MDGKETWQPGKAGLGDWRRGYSPDSLALIHISEPSLSTVDCQDTEKTHFATNRISSKSPTATPTTSPHIQNSA